MFAFGYLFGTGLLGAAESALRELLAFHAGFCPS